MLKPDYSSHDLQRAQIKFAKMSAEKNCSYKEILLPAYLVVRKFYTGTVSKCS